MKFKKYATKTLMIVIGSIISAYGITLAIGAGFGGVCSLHIGIRSIWASSVLLAIVCTMMVREHR